MRASRGDVYPGQSQPDRSSTATKEVYDEKVKVQPLEVGDEVLVLLPMKQNKLQLQWSGPYQVTRRVATVDYEVKRPGRRQEKKIYHVDLLKKWHPSSSSPALVAIVTEEHEQDPEELEIEYLLDTSSTQQKLAPKALSHLAPDQAGQIEQLLHKFSSNPHPAHGHHLWS